MASNEPPVLFDQDNPEWTEQDFARARPAAEVLPAEVIATFGKGPGRPAGSNKEKISIRLDQDVLNNYRKTGKGWQSRLNDALRRATFG